MIDRVISGGQTGVDRAALDAALETGLDCGGWCPKGRRAEDGVVPMRYPLLESDSANYRRRTRLNVVDSDGTLILVTGSMSGGTALTRELATAEQKPFFVVDLDNPAPRREVGRWIRDNNIRTLNVAGPRESQRPGIADRAVEYLTALFSELSVGGENSELSVDSSSTRNPEHD